MLAAVLNEPKDLHISEVETPLPAAGEVIVKVGATTLCGSDVRVYLGQKTGGVKWPAIIGHEFAGTIHSTGSDVDGFEAGQSVAVIPWIPCGNCDFCRSGRQNLCVDLEVLGYGRSGSLAEYVRIPARALAAGLIIGVSKEIPPAELALAEPLACCVHGHRRSDIKLGQSVLIVGGGPIGLFHTQLALLAGAATVIVSEPSESRRRFAKELGATHVVDPTQTKLAEYVTDTTGGTGVDHSIICIGYGGLINDAVHSMRKGGRVNLFAGFGGDGMANIDVYAVHYNELDIIGNCGGTRRDYLSALELIDSGRINAAAMITSRFDLADAASALEMATSGEALKVAIIASQE